MKKYKNLLAFLLGAIIGGSFIYSSLPETHTHENEEVHVHSDFLMVINGVATDLTGDEYQSSSEQVLHNDFHLHDNNDEVLHRHAEGITLTEFLGSLGFTLSDTCLRTSASQEYCSGEAGSLQLFVDGVEVTPISTYIPQEEDRILLSYGNDDPTTYFDEITEDACIYSLTCPEKGTPPPESCGLTCEL